MVISLCSRTWLVNVDYSIFMLLNIHVPHVHAWHTPIYIKFEPPLKKNVNNENHMIAVIDST